MAGELQFVYGNPVAKSSGSSKMNKKGNAMAKKKRKKKPSGKKKPSRKKKATRASSKKKHTKKPTKKKVSKKRASPKKRTKSTKRKKPNAVAFTTATNPRKKKRTRKAKKSNPKNPAYRIRDKKTGTLIPGARYSYASKAALQGLSGRYTKALNKLMYAPTKKDHKKASDDILQIKAQLRKAKDSKFSAIARKQEQRLTDMAKKKLKIEHLPWVKADTKLLEALGLKMPRYFSNRKKNPSKKKRSKKRRTTRKKNPSKGKRTMAKSKKRRKTRRKRKNPSIAALMSSGQSFVTRTVTGPLGTAALGGAIAHASEVLLAKHSRKIPIVGNYVADAMEYATAIPILGSSLVSIGLGAALKMVKNGYVQKIGDGMVVAGAVKLGAAAAQAGAARRCD